MEKSKLIVVEGAQGAGKTTVTDYIRHSLKYTNLYRLCGTSDSSPAGKKKAEEMYEILLEYTEKMQNKDINLLFDRTFFTEEIYCRLKKKEYSFTDVYKKLLQRLANTNFEIIYITLYLENEEEYVNRLDRKGKAVPDYAKFESENSIKQQKEYLKLADEIKAEYSNINVINIKNDRDFEDVAKELNTILDIKKQA